MTENMSFASESEVADLRESLSGLERRLEVALDDTRNTGAAHVQYRSAGDLVKALATGSSEARDFAKTSDIALRPAWVTDRLRVKVEDRKVINLFSREPLPASGLSVSYRVVSGEAGTVGEQLTEGAALGYMELAFEEKTAPVKTYGGYISLSRQVIDQADSAYLSKEVEYMVNQYAKATNDAVRAALVAGTGYNTGNLGTGTETAKMWIDVVTDSADLIEANARGPKAEFVLVSADVYKRLAHLVDTTGRPIFAHNGDGSNTLGAANIVAGTLNIAGLRVVKDAALAANSAFVAASDAVTTWETPGAPFRLEDENIINLTKDFSLYGYMAVGITNPLAVVKLDVDLV